MFFKRCTLQRRPQIIQSRWLSFEQSLEELIVSASSAPEKGNGSNNSNLYVKSLWQSVLGFKTAPNYWSHIFSSSEITTAAVLCSWCEMVYIFESFCTGNNFDVDIITDTFCNDRLLFKRGWHAWLSNILRLFITRFAVLHALMQSQDGVRKCHNISTCSCWKLIFNRKPSESFTRCYREEANNQALNCLFSMWFPPKATISNCSSSSTSVCVSCSSQFASLYT